MDGRMNLFLDGQIQGVSDRIKRMFPELKGRIKELYWECNINSYRKVEERRLVLILKNTSDAIYGYSSTDMFLIESDYKTCDRIVKSSYVDLIKNISDYLKLPYMDRKMRVIA